jgi:hypothetical protein
MLAALWHWFIGLFTREKIGILFIMLFKAGVSAVAEQIADLDLQKKALEFVRELAKRDDISNREKAAIFNEKMFEYAKKLGKVLCESVVNCLRELAVNALKAQRGM